jgi:GDPmannose 4,6-dehydratase
MFGQVDHEPQNEQTPFNPRVLYGVSKVMGHTLMKHYRNHHGLFTSTGIMYNHESPRRGIRFVTRKITLTAAKIKLGLERELRLGNIESQRDWGYAGDFIVAMHSALNAATPEDYVIATGKTRTIQDFLGVAFGELDLDYKKYLVVDPEFFRTKEKIPLVGDAQKAKANLNWQPRVSFEEMVRKMVQSDLDYMKKLGQG